MKDFLKLSAILYIGLTLINLLLFGVTYFLGEMPPFTFFVFFQILVFCVILIVWILYWLIQKIML